MEVEVLCNDLLREERKMSELYLVFLRRKGGICGGGIPPEKKVRRKKGGKLAIFWEN